MAVGTREIRRSNADACTRMYLHMMCLPGTAVAGSITSMTRRGTRLTTGQDRGWLSPCVCNTLRMVTRAVTQLYDDVLRPSGLRVTQFSILAAIARMGEANLRVLEDTLAIDQTTLTRSLNLLERDGVIERASHPDARIRGMKLTSKGRRALEAARPLFGPALKTRCSASWVRRHGLTPNDGSLTCCMSPSRGGGRVEDGGGGGRAAHREEEVGWLAEA